MDRRGISSLAILRLLSFSSRSREEKQLHRSGEGEELVISRVRLVPHRIMCDGRNTQALVNHTSPRTESTEKRICRSTRADVIASE